MRIGDVRKIPFVVSSNERLRKQKLALSRSLVRWHNEWLLEIFQGRRFAFESQDCKMICVQINRGETPCTSVKSCFNHMSIMSSVTLDLSSAIDIMIFEWLTHDWTLVHGLSPRLIFAHIILQSCREPGESGSKFNGMNLLLSAVLIFVQQETQMNFRNFLCAEVVIGIFAEDCRGVDGCFLEINSLLSTSHFVFDGFNVPGFDQCHAHFFDGSFEFPVQQSWKSKLFNFPVWNHWFDQKSLNRVRGTNLLQWIVPQFRRQSLAMSRI